jgi:Transglutaminase-like superfamily
VMSTWRRFAALSTSDRVLVAQAGLLLTLFRVGLWTLRFGTLQRIVKTCRTKQTPGPKPIGQIAGAVTTAASRLPFETTCLVRALAADVMLRRHGYSPELRFGVRKRGNGVTRLEGHAWLEWQGAVVFGEIDNRSDFTLFSAPRRS